MKNQFTNQFTGSKTLKEIFKFDKLAHVGVTFMLCAFFTEFFKYYGAGIWIAISSALIIGLFRELIQMNKSGSFNWLDMIANVLGVILFILYLDIQ